MKKNALIVFCGMDGAGKTTLSTKLVQLLQKKGYKTEFIHGHTYSISKSSFQADEQTVSRYRILFSLLLPLAYIDNIFTYFRFYWNKSRNTVSDRYFYDKVIRLMYYKICPRWLAKIYLLLLPKPNYLFFLDAEPNLAVKRKREYSKKEQTIFRQHYLFAARVLSAPIIDTAKPMKECLKKIVDRLET